MNEQPSSKEWNETPPNGGNGNNHNDIDAFAFIHWIDKSLKGKSPMKLISREYRLDSQLPFYRVNRHHKDGKGMTEFALGRRSFFHTLNLILDIIFQLLYAILRLMVYLAIFIIILRALQIPEYVMELTKT
jgi:hypothetical protein